MEHIDKIDINYIDYQINTIIEKMPEFGDEIYNFFSCFEKYPYGYEGIYFSHCFSKSFFALLKCDDEQLQKLYFNFGLLESKLPPFMIEAFDDELNTARNEFEWIFKEKILYKKICTIVNQCDVFFNYAYNGNSQLLDDSLDKKIINDLFFKKKGNDFTYTEIRDYLVGRDWILSSDQACLFILPICIKFLFEKFEDEAHADFLEYIEDFYDYAKDMKDENFDWLLIKESLSLMNFE